MKAIFISKEALIMSRQKNYADAASDQVAAQKARQKRVDY